MSLGSHITELRRKHQPLSEDVDPAVRSPGFIEFELAQLKKQKLRLKEEINRLEMV